MDHEMLENALKRIAELERKLELYYSLLKIDNELDFVINGTYLCDEELQNIMEGKY
ncbi:MAG: hypothetical protein IKM43_04245 [Clostridia bacterium]|nr:hypothetical protein [Clostridia bacterium]